MSAKSWILDPAHTDIEFGVKHMMFTTVRGRFADFEGKIRLDRDNPLDSSVTVDIDVSSIDTGVAQRDDHLRSADFFDVENHPTMTFRSKRVVGSIAPGVEFRIVGDLTILDHTHEVSLNATYQGEGTDPWGQTRVGFSATTTIDRRDFGLTWNQALEAGGVLVGHEVKIELQVQAVPKEEEATVSA